MDENQLNSTLSTSEKQQIFLRQQAINQQSMVEEANNMGRSGSVKSDAEMSMAIENLGAILDLQDVD